MKIEEKFVETKFGKICYLEAGLGSKAVIFLHGFFGDPQGIKYLASIFKDADVRVIAPYLPGHGKSFDLPKNMDFEQYISCIEETIHKVCKGKYLIIGSSFGARVGWELAKRDKNCLRALLHAPPLEKFPVGKLIPNLIFDWLEDESVGLYERMKKRNWLPQAMKLPKVSRFKVGQLPYLIKLFSSIQSVNTEPFKNTVSLLWGKKDRVFPYPKDKKVTLYSGGHFWFLRHYPKFHREIREFVLNNK